MIIPKLKFLAIWIGLILLAGAANYGQNPFFLREPIEVNAANAYPTVASLPISPFAPMAYNTESVIEQLSNSSTGIVRLPPGDYSITVRLY